jgi:hypothetical protein
VIITGTNFTGATAVNFGQYAASSYTVNSATQITAVAPPQAAGTVDLQITTIAGTSAIGSADHFTYNAAAVPAVTSLSTSSGPTGGGTNITITGTGFTGATAVKFGSVAATSFTVAADGSIFAIAPAGAAGTVDVRVTTFAGTSSTGTGDQLTYVADYSLTATGTGLNLFTGQNFNGQVASFTDGDIHGTASQFCVTIAWGDRTYTTGTVSGVAPSFVVIGSHTYTAAGTYTINVQINDVGGASASATSSANVMNPHSPSSLSIQATGTQATATAGVQFRGIVASFSDPFDAGPASHFTTTITWGDGNSSTGTVTPNAAGGWDITGKDTYVQAGTYTVTVKITDSKNNSASATSTITVVGGSGGNGPNALVLSSQPTTQLGAPAPNGQLPSGFTVTMAGTPQQALPSFSIGAVSAAQRSGTGPTLASVESSSGSLKAPRSANADVLSGGSAEKVADGFWEAIGTNDEAPPSLAWQDTRWLLGAIVDDVFAAVAEASQSR